MIIIATFEIVTESLYSVQYESETTNELTKCFELWNDPIYLREFFENHKDDLNHEFWNGMTIEDAILKTRKDAKLLERKILDVAEIGKTERLETLSTLFEPLSKGVIEDFEKDKAKGMINPSWLRIYGIRLEANLFVVSGSAIKLTRTMNEREHLNIELEKLEKTQKYLMDEDNDELDFIEFY